MADNTDELLLENNARADADYQFLLARGIEFLQQLTGSKWTDYNVHDPGVTILEFLCYAINDFAYRADFDIKDILTTRPDGLIDGNKNALYTVADILTSKPITVIDYRKIIIDGVDEVENAWIEPLKGNEGLTGYYKVAIQTNKKVEAEIKSNSLASKRVTNKVKALLNENRNLCEQFVDFEILEPQEVVVNAKVLIGNKVPPEQILAQILFEIEKYLYGQVQFNTLYELIDKGHKVDEVVQGPKLNKGYLLDSGLGDRIKEISISDINKVIIGIEGVENVKGLSIAWDGVLEGQDLLVIDKGKYPVLNTNFIKQINNYSIKIFKENFEYPIDKDLVEKLLRDLWAVAFRAYQIVDPKENRPPLPSGTFRQMDQYFSIQNDFPKNYLIDSMGLPNNLPKVRKAQANQLKGYLMLFEQLMANYFAQLQSTADFFSIDVAPHDDRTYFTQPLYTVPDADRVIKAFEQRKDKIENATQYKDRWEQFKKSGNDYTTALSGIVESRPEYLQRKNKMLDHLMARFGEYIDDYALSSYKYYYGEERGSKEQRALEVKSQLLKNYVAIGYNRAKAFDWKADYWGTENLSGLELKANLLLGLQDLKRKRLSNINGAGKLDNNTVQNSASTEQKVQSIKVLEEQINVLSNSDIENIKWSDELGNVENALVFRSVTNSSFSQVIVFGADINNYRVAPITVDGKKAYVVLYKSPEQENWSIIGKFGKKPDANEAVRKTIAYFINLSIDTEGFHLVEHSLLESAFEEEKFGFYFIDKRGRNFLTNYNLVDYYNRFDLARDVVKFGKTREGYFMDRVNNEEFRLVIHNDKEEPIAMTTRNFKLEQYGGKDAEDAIKLTIKNITLMDEQENLFRSFVNTYSTLADGTKVPGDFFDFQATVVLPNWPIRFQDEGFKIFLQNTFRNHAPAQVKLNFVWLDISAMDRFEDLYGKWLETFKANEAKIVDNEPLSEQLIKFLLSNIDLT